MASSVRMDSFEDAHSGSPAPYSPLQSGSGSGRRPLPASQNRPLAPLNVDKRGDHPRGCRFRDLGEAHRNITGRSISAACGAEPGGLTGSLSRSTDNTTDLVSPQRNVTSPVTFGVPVLYEASPPDFEKSPESCTPPRRKGTNDAVSPEEEIDNIFGLGSSCSSSRPSPSPLSITTAASVRGHHESPAPQLPNMPQEGSLHDENEDFSRLSLHTIANQNRSSGSQMVMTVDSKDTTVRMYKQYQEFIRSQPSPTPVPFQKAPCRREVAESRVSCSHDGSPGGAANDSPVSDPAPHSSMLPGGPSEESGKLENMSSSARPQSMFMSMPTRESLLYPKPLRVQSIRAEGKHSSLYSGAAVSGTGMTTDSEEDPFRYDKDAYKIFLHPSKERDVSTALNHIGGINSYSRATLHGAENGPAVGQVALRQPPLARKYVDNDPFFLGPTRARSTTPESGDGFYDTSVIQPNWAVERSEYEVKVVLQDVSRNNSMNASSRRPNEPERSAASSKIHRTSFFRSTHTGSLSRRKDKENAMLSSERDDWETVATSVPGLGSRQLSLPPAAREYGSGKGPLGTKMTGSSIADVSDDGSFSHDPFDAYASTDRIVHHPSGHEDSEESLQIRNLSGTKVPIMIPKQRVHRVNGFAQDSLRVLPQPSFSGGRHTRQFSPTPLHHPLPYKLEKGKSKFEFHQSFQASDRDTFGSKQVYEFKGVSSSETGNTQSDANNNTTSETVEAVAQQGDDSFSLRDSGSSQSSHRTIHSFPFPLIPLPEAARIEAVRRKTVPVEAGDSAARPYWDSTYVAKGRAHPDRRPYHRSPTAFFASLFSPSSSTTQSSCYHAQRYSRLKKSRAIPNDLTVPSTISAASTGNGGELGGSTWASFFPLGSGSGHSGPSHLLRSAATKLQLDNLGRKLYYPRKQRGGFTIGSGGILSRSNTPRLYPWDYPMRRQRERGQRSTDPELQAIALPECQRIHGFHGSRHSHKHMHDLERTGVPLDPEAFLSRNARQKREVWFYCVLAASMFPFIAVLVYMGKFDNALSWFTRGEVSRLSSLQRRAILLMMVLQFVLWPIALGVVIWQMT